MDRSPYRLYYLNNHIQTFATRDAALNGMLAHATKTGHDIGNYEILDRSDA